MVSRETYKVDAINQLGFVAGLAALSATFFQTRSARYEQFGFQMKLSRENFELLELVRHVIGIKTKVNLYAEGSTTYALLNTRSKKILLTRVIPFMDQYLRGPKLKNYLLWKESLINSV